MKKLNFMLALGIILALVLVPACSTSEDADDATSIIDIRGTWDFDIDCPGCYWTTIFADVTLSGSITGGSTTFVAYPGTIAEFSATGSWTLSGSTFTLQVTIAGDIWQFNGIAASASSMSGSATLNITNATWTATK